MRGSIAMARASAVRCFCPPDSVMPRSPTTCRSPSESRRRPCRGGRRRRRRCVDRAARRSAVGRRRASRPNATLSASVSENRNGSCGTNPIAPRSGASGSVAHVDAVDEHRARRRIVQPREQADQRRLAGAGGADEGDRLAGVDVRPRCRWSTGVAAVGERQVAELDVARGSRPSGAAVSRAGRGRRSDDVAGGRRRAPPASASRTPCRAAACW